MIQWERIQVEKKALEVMREEWDGALPTVTGSAVPMLSLPTGGKE